MDVWSFDPDFCLPAGGWVADCPPDELRKGLPVEVFFEAVTEEVTLPKFRRARS